MLLITDNFTFDTFNSVSYNMNVTEIEYGDELKRIIAVAGDNYEISIKENELKEFINEKYGIVIGGKESKKTNGITFADVILYFAWNKIFLLIAKST